MRRFIASLPGKVFSQLVSLALLLPWLSFTLATKAEAQAVQNPSYAVVHFQNLKSPGTTYGVGASQAVSSELTATGRYDVIPEATVAREAEALGMTMTPETDTDLLRLAQQVRARSVVSGEIVDYVIRNSGSGRQAVVAMRVIVTDVASGLAVNGAAIVVPSVTRAGNVEESVLINDAIAAAARQAVQGIERQTLPTGTVLNTSERQVLINQGLRTGFREGQNVIVLRGRDQVATARVVDAEPDQSILAVERFYRGVQPGDRVRAIFEVPALPRLTAEGRTGRVRSAGRPGNIAPLLTVAAVLLVGVLLFSGGNGSDQRSADRMNAEATLFPDITGTPAVRLSWSPNGFAKGNAQRALWQIYRNGQGGVSDVPVLVVPGSETSVVDTGAPRSFNYAFFGGQIGIPNGDTCRTGSTDAGIGNQAGVTPGQPYVYDVQLVFGLSTFDLPTGTGGSTANTAGNTTTGGNTGTNTTGANAGTNTTGANAGGGNPGGGSAGGGNPGGGNAGGGLTRQAALCYFLSDRTRSRGQATPLSPPQLVSPAENATVSNPIPFTFNSVVSVASIQVEYVVQLSDSPTFPRDRSRIVRRFTSGQRGIVASTTVDTRGSDIPSFIRNAQVVYFRVGARNIQDRPGPARDPLTRERYIFSSIRSFRRPVGPPDPPGGTGGGTGGPPNPPGTTG